MLTYDDDTITVNSKPTNFEELGAVNISDMNILIYY